MSRKPSIPKQQSLSSKYEEEREFGGARLKKSHAKKARPIPLKKSMHLTLRSSKARGDKSFLLNRNRIKQVEKVVRTQAHKFGVEVNRYANVGNHLHLLVKVSYRKGFIAFLRAISGIIARIALGAERGQAKLKEQTQFWDQRPWTKVILTWTEFVNVRKYVEQNFNEAMGFVRYTPRKYRSTG